jgi:hypothetical protein
MAFPELKMRLFFIPGLKRLQTEHLELVYQPPRLLLFTHQQPEGLV